MSAPPHSVRYIGRIRVGKEEEPVSASRVCCVKKKKIFPTDASHSVFVTSIVTFRGSWHHLAGREASKDDWKNLLPVITCSVIGSLSSWMDGWSLDAPCIYILKCL